MIFADTNVVLDIMQDDPRWADWSLRQLEAAAITGSVVVNPVVIAELSRDFDTLDALMVRLMALQLTTEPLDAASAFLAGKRFIAARRERVNSTTSRPLPDFFIGAHALTLDARLLTRDTAIYRRHFPDLTLITPEMHP